MSREDDIMPVNIVYMAAQCREFTLLIMEQNIIIH